MYKIKKFSDKKLADIYEENMESLGKFFGLKWTRNTPRIVIVEDRKTIDDLRQAKTDDWLVGWAESRTIFILNRSKMGKESRIRYSDKEYEALIGHELCHAFCRAIWRPSTYCPMWFSEGIAIYASGQNKFKAPVTEFKSFLGFHKKRDREIYSESGFAVQALVDGFGKKKLIGLIKRMKSVDSKTGFIELFKEIYGFNPTYKAFNELIK